GGLAPQLVFVPTRSNLQEAVATYDLAVELGCSAFIPGPLMRIGRAAADWDRIACREEEWQAAVLALRQHAESRGAAAALSIYPRDILAEMELRRGRPAAPQLGVPHGKRQAPHAPPFPPDARAPDCL